MGHNGRRLSSDSSTDICDEIDDEYVSSADDDDLIGDLDLDADIPTNLKKLKKHSLILSEQRPSLQLRSFSESNLKKTKYHKKKNKKYNHDAGDDGGDDEDDEFLDDDDIYNKYVSMKKKYKEQRRISKQFQEAITSIQDDNEETLNETESTIRDEFETEFEIKLIKLEHDKLNNTLEIEEKMKILIVQNEHLMNSNKQLQQQVVAQVSTIQQQQQITVQQQQMMQRQLSSGSCGIGSPVAVIQSSTHSGPHSGGNDSRRISFGSNNSFNNHISNALIPNFKNIDQEKEKEKRQYIIEDDEDDDDDEILNNKSAAINMEPSHKYTLKVKKRTKLNDLEAKLIEYDNEIKMKIGDGLSPWDRFWQLMTPSFCSCSPPSHITK
eukprot:375337_1